MAQEYWFCIIGPVERGNLPDGADFPMRMAVKGQFLNMTDLNAESCWSGWGVSEKRKDELVKMFIGLKK